MKKMNSKIGNKVFGTLVVTCSLTVIGLLLNSNCRGNNVRDYAYENYCDSIFYNDKDYYYDVLVETDEYQEYLEKHGQWWEEDCPAYLEMEAKYKELEGRNNFKKELLDAQFDALEKAKIVMDKNELFDKDGSDEMYEYLEAVAKCDSLIATQL